MLHHQCTHFSSYSDFSILCDTLCGMNQGFKVIQVNHFRVYWATHCQLFLHVVEQLSHVIHPSLSPQINYTRYNKYVFNLDL